MMRVYQPLCPDITFRLAADLSPDTLEDDTSPTSSSSSSSPGEEPKLRYIQDGDYNAHNNNPPTWPYTQNAAANTTTTTSLNDTTTTTSSPPPASKCAKEIYNQGHSSQSTSTASATTAATSPSCSSTPSSTSASAMACGDQAMLSSQSDWEGVDKGHEELEAHTDLDAGDGECGSRCSSQTAPLYSETPTLSFTPPSADTDDKSPTPPHHHLKPEDDQDDDDSIDDVSISHNVPNHAPISITNIATAPPSPSGVSSSSSPLVGRRLLSRGEESGGASGSSSDSDVSTNRKSPRLHLDIQRPLTKYLGPYTLACDVTPSPLQEGVSMASTLPTSSPLPSHPATSSGDASAATTSTTSSPALTTPTSNGITTIGGKVPRRPRKLPEIPRKHQGMASASNAMERSIFDEIQEALIKEVSDDVAFDPSSTAPDTEPGAQYPYILKHAGYLFDKKRLLIGYATSQPSKPTRSRNVSTSSGASEAGAAASVEEEMSAVHAQSRTSGAVPSASMCSQRRRKNSDGDGSRRYGSSAIATPYQDLEVTHRGMHRFIPRHADEVQIGIGDPIHVIKEYDDLWCEGVNLRTGERGIFPGMYANDLRFLEDSDGDEDEHWKFTMRYLGSVEVSSPSGDYALCQAINKVAQQGRIKTASLCILEINQYGIRMIDKSKEGHESQKFSNFFALKNISFCGTHPNNKRYFAFITKHPRENRFACHVFHSDRSTHRARDALGSAFKRFYQEYMAFTHPTEDIWIE